MKKRFVIREQIGKYNKARIIELGRSKTDIFLQPPCKALQPIRDCDKGESEEKSKAASKLSQQGGERVEKDLQGLSNEDSDFNRKPLL